MLFCNCLTYLSPQLNLGHSKGEIRCFQKSYQVFPVWQILGKDNWQQASSTFVWSGVRWVHVDVWVKKRTVCHLLYGLLEMTQNSGVSLLRRTLSFSQYVSWSDTSGCCFKLSVGKWWLIITYWMKWCKSKSQKLRLLHICLHHSWTTITVKHRTTDHTCEISKSICTSTYKSHLYLPLSCSLYIQLRKCWAVRKHHIYIHILNKASGSHKLENILTGKQVYHVCVAGETLTSRPDSRALRSHMCLCVAAERGSCLSLNVCVGGVPTCQKMRELSWFMGNML